MGIRVIIVDDHKVMREGLSSLLREKGIEVVAEAGDGRTAVELAGRHSPDVVIMDIGIPGLNGIEAARRIISHNPGVKVIALTMHSERQYVMETLKAGASGFLLKDNAFEELVTAINSVVAGKTYICPAVSNVLLKDYIYTVREQEASPFSVLSEREREVLQLIAEGKSTKEIAGILKLSIKTIETHRRQIMEKLDIHNVADLTKYAIKEGLIEL